MDGSARLFAQGRGERQLEEHVVDSVVPVDPEPASYVAINHKHK
jgi:hypothetical protein